jgi:F0F1-type ATP synthase membrane subunit b/b'
MHQPRAISLSCARIGADKEETMSKATTIKVGLAGAAALLVLSACVSPDEVSSLDNRVGELERRLDTADARASQAEAAANQCTATCQEVEVRAQRMIQQSVTK